MFAKLCERESDVSQSCLTLRNPMDCSLPGYYKCHHSPMKLTT